MKYCNMGFAAVDATGLDVADTEEQTVEGIYQQLVKAIASNMPVMMYGAVSSDSDITPYVVRLTTTNTAVVIDGALNVSSGDVVTPVSI